MRKTVILSRLRALDPNCPPDIIQTIFLDQLPSSCRAVLAVTGEADLDKIAEIADRVVEAQESGSVQVSAVNSHKVLHDSVNSQSQIDRLTVMFETFAKDLAAVKSQLAHSRRKRQDRARSKSRPKSPHQISDSSNTSLCKWHRKFGDKACMCQQSCLHWSSHSQTVSEKSEN